MADPIVPSPYQGVFMVGLQSAVYETKTTENTVNYAAGTLVDVDTSGGITLTLPDGSKETYPTGTTVITNVDGTVSVTTYTTEQVLVSPATPCDIGWVYDPATGTFSAS